MNYKDFGVQRFEGKLENGMRVVLFQRVGSPVYIRAAIKAGSCYDPEGKEGLSHFLEHMMTNGSSRFPTKDLLAGHIEAVGGMYGLSTSNELLCVNTEVGGAEDIDYALDILRATICEPTLDPAKLENEKAIILAEYGQTTSNPNNFLLTQISKVIFDGTRFSHRPLGYPESIASITIDDIKMHYKQRIHSKNIVIVAAGDISFDHLINKLNELPFPSNSDLLDDSLNYGLSLDTCNVRIPHESKHDFIFYGFKGDETFSHDALLLKILGVILAGGRSSRLMKRLRHDLGLIYDFQQIRIGNLYASAYGITTNATQTNNTAVIAAFDEVFFEVAQNGITESEMNFAKNRTIKSLKRNMQRSSNWVDFHFYGELLAADSYWTLEKYISLVESVTAEGLQQIARKYFIQDKKYIVTIGQ